MLLMVWMECRGRRREEASACGGVACCSRKRESRHRRALVGEEWKSEGLWSEMLKKVMSEVLERWEQQLLGITSRRINSEVEVGLDR